MSSADASWAREKTVLAVEGCDTVFFSADKTYSQVGREEAIVVRLLRTTSLSMSRGQRATEVLPLAQQANAALAVVRPALTAVDVVFLTSNALRVRRAYELEKQKGKVSQGSKRKRERARGRTVTSSATPSIVEGMVTLTAPRPRGPLLSAYKRCAVSARRLNNSRHSGSVRCLRTRSMTGAGSGAYEIQM